MESRGKKMVSLALNKELHKKISQFKNNNNKKEPKQRRNDDDPDYQPPLYNDYSSVRSRHSDDTDLENLENYSEHGNKIANTRTKLGKESTRVIILSDITLGTISENDTVQRRENNSQEAFFEQNEVWIKNLLLKVVNQVADMREHSKKCMYTKKGIIRKRKLFDAPLAERKKQKLQKKKKMHTVKLPCTKCVKNCPKNIDAQRQNEINSQFWEMSNTDQRTFLFGCIKKCPKGRKTTQRDSRRENSFKYFLKDVYGLDISVCKTFLLATLGFHPSNDSLLKSVRSTESTAILPRIDKRGHHPNPVKIDRSLIGEHIKSFRPVISHYRREHAPNKLYLPADISATLMYKDFKEKNANLKMSYELYRKEIRLMNISFARLGNEECFECEKFNLHSNSSIHHKNNLIEDCESCMLWKRHKEKYDTARELYQSDGKQVVPDKLVVSGDLQKVYLMKIPCFRKIKIY